MGGVLSCDQLVSGSQTYVYKCSGWSVESCLDAPAMKRLYLICWALATSVALSPNPCDFPEICFPPVASFDFGLDLEDETIAARCYSACIDDVSELKNQTFQLVNVYLHKFGCAPIHRGRSALQLMFLSIDCP